MLPDTDLRDYAAARGLDHRGNATQIGYMAALGMSEELQFNILRGTLPGGEQGIVFHDVRVLEGGTSFGLKYGEQISGPKRSFGLLDFTPLGGLTSGRPTLFKLAFTTAAIRVPEAAGLLLGLSVTRAAEGGAVRAAGWAPVNIEGGPRGWEVSIRERATRAVVEDVVANPIVDLLEGAQPLGFQILYRFGTLMLSQQHFAAAPQDLDLLCEKASWLAARLRETCARHAQPLDFATGLPEPDWLAEIRSKPIDDTFLGGDAQNLGSVVRLADATGLQIEDPFAYMRGFPHVPVPGEAFGVLRGTLPGSTAEGRLVACIERPAWERKDVQKALKEKIGGPFGCDAVLVAVDPSTPETPGVDGEQWIEGGRVAVKRGVLAAWRKRERVSVQRHEVEALVADTLGCVRNRT